jgi:hypothetical protein
VTLVSVPGTVISRPQLSRIRYEALPVLASQASETLHDVLPVERRLNGLAGAFFASVGGPSAVIDGATGSVVSRHAAPTTRIDPARAHANDCRTACMRRLRCIRDSGWSLPARSVSVLRTAVATHLADERIKCPWLRKRCPALRPAATGATLAPPEGLRNDLGVNVPCAAVNASCTSR